jgi:hypothetical protein
MIWPHQQQFPHRTKILALGCTFALLIASLWPGLSLSERAVMPVFTIYGIASGFFTYGLLLMLLRFVPSFHTFIALTLFYGALTCLLVFLVQTVVVAVSSHSTSPYQEALSFAITVPASLGIAAAAFSALNRRASPSNNRWRGP